MVIGEDILILNDSRVSVIENDHFTKMGFVFGERSLMSTRPRLSCLFFMEDIAGCGKPACKGCGRAGQKSSQKYYN